jgi:hypothetical protein
METQFPEWRLALEIFFPGMLLLLLRNIILKRSLRASEIFLTIAIGINAGLGVFTLSLMPSLDEAITLVLTALQMYGLALAIGMIAIASRILLASFMTRVRGE